MGYSLAAYANTKVCYEYAIYICLRLYIYTYFYISLSIYVSHLQM